MLSMLFRLRLFLVLALAALGAAPVRGEPSRAAFVTAIELRGADETAGTAIRREGKELRPRLFMPLFAGDEVFLREAASRIVLETAGGAEQSVSGAGARFVVTGDAVAGGGFWNMLDAVADAIGGESDDIAPDNMMSRDSGDVLGIPMAVHGANFIVDDGSPLWLAWSGGTAPYRIRISADGVALVLHGILANDTVLDLPKPLPSRIKITLEDAGGRSAHVSLRRHEERPNAGFGDVRAGLAKDLAYAAWLTGFQDGGWTIEAARLLRQEATTNPAARRLLNRIATGWRADGLISPQSEK